MKTKQHEQQFELWLKFWATKMIQMRIDHHTSVATQNESFHMS